jgi:ribosomal protein S18 acetylase RimI-like enzyme
VNKQPDVYVREARPEEYAEIGDITVEAYLAVPNLIDGESDYYLGELRNVAGRAAESDILVAVTGEGRLLGAVAFVADTKSELAEWDVPDVAGFRMLAVHPSAQGMGAGQRLTEACIELAQQSGKQALVLHTTKFQSSAHGLYDKLNFVRDTSIDVDLGFMLLMGYRLNF